MLTLEMMFFSNQTVNGGKNKSTLETPCTCVWNCHLYLV